MPPPKATHLVPEGLTLDEAESGDNYQESQDRAHRKTGTKHQPASHRGGRHASSRSAVEIESALRRVDRRDGDHLQSSRTARRFCLVTLLARVARVRCLCRQNTVDRSSSFDSTRVPDPRGRSSGEPRPGASAGGPVGGDSVPGWPAESRPRPRLAAGTPPCGPPGPGEGGPPAPRRTPTGRTGEEPTVGGTERGRYWPLRPGVLPLSRNQSLLSLRLAEKSCTKVHSLPLISASVRRR